MYNWMVILEHRLNALTLRITFIITLALPKNRFNMVIEAAMKSTLMHKLDSAKAYQLFIRIFTNSCSLTLKRKRNQGLLIVEMGA